MTTQGPRATDGAPTGSLIPRRRPRLCPRSTHPVQSRPDHRGGGRNSAGSRGRRRRVEIQPEGYGGARAPQGLMEHQAEGAQKFGTGTGREMFPVIQRYAKQIQQRYDVLLLPNGIETMIYAGCENRRHRLAMVVVRQRAEREPAGAPAEAEPIANPGCRPPVPKVDMDDCEEFITSVLFDDPGTLEDENVGLGIIPRPLEVQIYRNAVTAVT